MIAEKTETKKKGNAHADSTYEKLRRQLVLCPGARTVQELATLIRGGAAVRALQNKIHDLS